MIKECPSTVDGLKDRKYVTRLVRRGGDNVWS